MVRIEQRLSVNEQMNFYKRGVWHLCYFNLCLGRQATLHVIWTESHIFCIGKSTPGFKDKELLNSSKQVEDERKNVSHRNKKRCTNDLGRAYYTTVIIKLWCISYIYLLGIIIQAVLQNLPITERHWVLTPQNCVTKR